MNNLCATERAIIGAVVDDALARGFVLSVYDGCAFSVRVSRDKAAISAEIGATDETVLRFRDPSIPDEVGIPAYVGFVQFVHGNAADVIADCSDVPAVRDVLRRAEALAERLG